MDSFLFQRHELESERNRLARIGRIFLCRYLTITEHASEDYGQNSSPPYCWFRTIIFESPVDTLFSPIRYHSNSDFNAFSMILYISCLFTLSTYKNTSKFNFMYCIQ